MMVLMQSLEQFSLVVVVEVHMLVVYMVVVLV